MIENGQGFPVYALESGTLADVLNVWVVNNSIVRPHFNYIAYPFLEGNVDPSFIQACVKVAEARLLYQLDPKSRPKKVFGASALGDLLAYETARNSDIQLSRTTRSTQPSSIGAPCTDSTFNHLLETLTIMGVPALTQDFEERFHIEGLKRRDSVAVWHERCPRVERVMALNEGLANYGINAHHIVVLAENFINGNGLSDLTKLRAENVSIYPVVEVVGVEDNRIVVENAGRPRYQAAFQF